MEVVLSGFFFQMVNLEQYQLDWLCNHLGHKRNIHKEHYRHMSGLVERVYITKLLMIQDLNKTQKYQGQNLKDINITGIVIFL